MKLVFLLDEFSFVAIVGLNFLVEGMSYFKVYASEKRQIYDWFGLGL